jgi:hypothetical protein
MTPHAFFFGGFRKEKVLWAKAWNLGGAFLDPFFAIFLHFFDDFFGVFRIFSDLPKNPIF